MLVLITFLCNGPISFFGIFKFTSSSDNVINFFSQYFSDKEDIELYVLQPLQFLGGLMIFFYALSDPFFYAIGKEKLRACRTVLRCGRKPSRSRSYIDKKELKRQLKLKKAMEKSGNLASYFSSCLSFEIIYTTLNGVIQQLNNEDKSVLLKKKYKSKRRQTVADIN